MKGETMETTISVRIKPFGQMEIKLPSMPCNDILPCKQEESEQIRYVSPEDTASGLSEFLFEEESANYTVPRVTG